MQNKDKSRGSVRLEKTLPYEQQGTMAVFATDPVFPEEISILSTTQQEYC